MYPRALQNLGNYNGNVAWVITAITSPQWMLERCITEGRKKSRRELTRDMARYNMIYTL